MITRLPVAWWWLPVQEHPGSIEGARAWQVMASIHDYILENKDEDGNITVKDDKTGECAHQGNPKSGRERKPPSTSALTTSMKKAPVKGMTM